MTTFPIISVIIPTYNYAAYIQEAIISIIEQNYPKDKIEIIVVDDGSTDNTRQVLDGFIQNNIVRYFFQENEGKASATYKAIQNATGKYIFNLDADDYFLPGKIRKTVEVFEADDDIVHVASPAKQLLPGGGSRDEPVPAKLIEKKLDGMVLLRQFMNNNMLFGGGSTYAARSTALKKIEIPVAVDMFTDEFLVLAILPFGNSFFINDYLSVWRWHGNNYSLTTGSKEKQMAKGARLLKSSDGILTYLIREQFDVDVVKIYRLKNLTNKLSFKENAGKKSMRDIIKYANNVIFQVKPGWKLIRKYNVLNRLIPTHVLLFLKNRFAHRNKNFLASL